MFNANLFLENTKLSQCFTFLKKKTKKIQEFDGVSHCCATSTNICRNTN